MMMFAIGFLCAWVLIAIFAYVSDGNLHNGITLFDGWGVVILLFPVYVFVYIFLKPIWYFIDKNKKEDDDNE
jgi:hypothetical protein